MVCLGSILSTAISLFNEVVLYISSFLVFVTSIHDKFVSINSSLISVYGIIFTIIIAIIFYVYGKNGIERKVLQNGTKINEIIKYSLIYFLVSTIALPHTFFILLNSFFILHIMYLCFKSFGFIEKFYKSVISDKEITDEYIKENIRSNISKYYAISEENKQLNDEIENLGKVTRFLSSDRLDAYELIKSTKSGYIQKIDIGVFKSVLSKDTFKEKTDTSQNPEEPIDIIYIPFNISKGVSISEGDILYAVKKGYNLPKNAIQITDKNFFPVQDYLNVALKEKFKEVFEHIKEGNHKLVEEKLEEASTYINFVFDEEKFNTNLIGQISAEFIYPLQEEAFKRGDFRVVRQVSSFSLKYLHKSIEQKSKEKFEIFINNITISFYYSLKLKDLEVKKSYQEVLSHWLYELFEYSLKSKVQNNSNDVFYSETLERSFVAINNMLRYAYQESDKKSLDSITYLVSSIFSEDRYRGKNEALSKSVRLKKQSVIFGFTSCVYRDMKSKGSFDNETIQSLYDLMPKDLEGLLRSASEALSLSDNGKFNWDNLSWSMKGTPFLRQQF